MHWNVILMLAGILTVSIGLVAYVRRAKKNEHIISQKWPHRFSRGYELTPMQLRHDFTSIVGWFKERGRSRRQRRLDHLREQLQAKVEELAQLEEVMASLHPNRTIEQVMHFVNGLQAKYWGSLNGLLFLDPKNGAGLNTWLDRHIDRDVVKDCWYFAPQFADVPSAAKELQERLIPQRNLWTKRRNSLRRDCMQYQQVIEGLEKSLGIKQPEAETETPDKRAQLKKLRAQLTEIKLEEERLECEILADENKGADAPHRAKAAVSTED